MKVEVKGGFLYPKLKENEAFPPGVSCGWEDGEYELVKVEKPVVWDDMRAADGELVGETAILHETWRVWILCVEGCYWVVGTGPTAKLERPAKNYWWSTRGIARLKAVEHWNEINRKWLAEQAEE